mmetsp:Transcript_46737/g.109009  ORF Transcript_46737/g.109009 Transcript_46737/m.109009 type:complete len:223 (-) Transcript_46737:994-1662(-)
MQSVPLELSAVCGTNWYSSWSWPPEKKMSGTLSRTNRSMSSNGWETRVSGADGAKWRASKHIRSTCKGDMPRVQRKISSTGCPLCPKMCTRFPLSSKTFCSYGLQCDLKFSRPLDLWKKCCNNGICGMLRLVGSLLPGMRSTGMWAETVDKNVSTSSSIAVWPNAHDGYVPPHTINRATDKACKPRSADCPVRKSNKRALDWAPSALPIRKPDTKATTGPAS